jgi:hypothetical protein
MVSKFVSVRELHGYTPWYVRCSTCCTCCAVNYVLSVRGIHFCPLHLTPLPSLPFPSSLLPLTIFLLPFVLILPFPSSNLPLNLLCHLPHFFSSLPYTFLLPSFVPPLAHRSIASPSSSPLHFTALPSPVLYCNISHYTALSSPPLSCTALSHTTLHYPPLSYTAPSHTTLHYPPLPCPALHYLTLYCTIITHSQVFPAAHKNVIYSSHPLSLPPIP